MIEETPVAKLVAQSVSRALALVRRFAPYGGVVDPEMVDRAPHRLPTQAEWEEALYLVRILAALAEWRHVISVDAEAACATLARRVRELENAS